MILQTFFQYLTYEKRFSAHTITAYKSDLDQFQQFVEQTYDISDLLQVTTGFTRSWMVHLMQQNMDVRSIRRKRSVLNTFFNFALKQEVLEINPMEQVSVPKIKKKLPTYLRESELQNLDKVLPEMVDFPTARDRTIIELLIGTGMRRAELLGLKLGDLRLSERSLRVLGKRNKERIVPLTTSVSNTLHTYLQFRAELEVDIDSVFLTDNRKPLYPKFVYNLVKRFVSLITSAEAKGPHVLRHTFATLMLDEGADINAIKELLGHADLNATQVYTHTSIEKLKAAYGKAHPKAETTHKKP